MHCMQAPLPRSGTNSRPASLEPSQVSSHLSFQVSLWGQDLGLLNHTSRHLSIAPRRHQDFQGLERVPVTTTAAVHFLIDFEFPVTHGE